MPEHPPARQPRRTLDGSIDIDQHRKRAKDLLKALRRGEPAALARLARHHPAAARQPAPRLADAQLVVAREAGFASWPRLRAHGDAMALRRRAVHAGNPPRPDTPGTLHIRCGSDIRHALGVAGFAGPFLEFSDPFCQGPVPDLPQDAFVEARARFIAAAYGLDPADARGRQARAYGALDRLGDHERLVLWFEHDSYDQLILAFLLDRLSRLPAAPPAELICVDSVPGVPGFVGLGHLAPETLLWLWESRRSPVGDDQLALGRRAWAALRQPAPDALAAIAAAGTPAIPPMAAALRRHLRELPAPDTGLGLTQRLTLEIVAEAGPITAGAAFDRLMREREPLPFLGDLMFRHVLDDLGDTTVPLLADDGTAWPRRLLTITETGRAVLAGAVDFLSLYRGERWVGGIRIRGRAGS